MKDLKSVQELVVQRGVDLETQYLDGAVAYAFGHFGIINDAKEWAKISDGWRLVLRPGLYLDMIETDRNSGRQPYLTRYKRNRRGIGKGMETSYNPIYSPEDFLRQLQNWGIEP